ncbi:MAG: hemerythrin domain-containing protein [Chloroflexi bacterium]|nr:hemerythrin domain-containing protein [Chloroflexota bacterium]
MRPTEQLMEEHNGIKRMLRIMDRVCQKLESGQAVETEHLDGILEFIRVFADRCHHGKEEDLLFPAMEAAGIPTEGGPAGVMLVEHNLGRGYVKGFAEAIARYKAGEQQASPQIVENARGYVALLTQHIDKEEGILYRMADRHISKEKQRELLEEFERVERERIGPGKHEEFHRLLDRLGSIYIT